MNITVEQLHAVIREGMADYLRTCRSGGPAEKSEEISQAVARAVRCGFFRVALAEALMAEKQTEGSAS